MHTTTVANTEVIALPYNNAPKKSTNQKYYFTNSGINIYIKKLRFIFPYKFSEKTNAYWVAPVIIIFRFRKIKSSHNLVGFPKMNTTLLYKSNPNIVLLHGAS